tara:strand:- start:4238 stop:6679 length:2442 start_codon:yes stop_codon:yes gene_type:complete
MTQKNQPNLFNGDGQNSNGHSSLYRGQQPIGNGYYGGQQHADWGDPGSDEIDLTKLFGAIFRYKWWVIGITVLATTFAFIIANTVTPEYESSGTVLIMDQQGSVAGGGTDLSEILQQSYGVGAMTRINNEIQTLQSRQLSDAIAQKLMEQEVMENGEVFPILYLGENGDNGDSTRVTESQLSNRIRERLVVERVDRESDILRIAYRSPSPFEARELVNITIDTYTEISASQRRVAANSALSFLDNRMEEISQQLADSEDRLETYMNQTNLVQIDGQTTALINRMADLETQLQQVQVQRVSINSSIESYESQLERIRPGLADQLSENISGQIERAQFRLAELQIERTLILQNNPALRANPEVEPQFMAIENEIESIRQEIRGLTNSLLEADDSDAYIGFLGQEDGGVAARISELRRNIIEQRIQESQLNAQEEALTQRLASENQFFDTLPQNMMELARLQRDRNINEQLYSTISTQYQETQLWEQTQYGSGRPIDYAILANEPASPRKPIYILIGFMIGGILSVGGVLLKENFNRSIDGAEKLKATGYPLLSVIPNMRHVSRKKYNGREFIKVNGRIVSTSWAVLLDNISPMSESYRRLHNNIIFSNTESDYRTLLVTSPKQGEGKTTVSINLAVALAESGKKVLLIDTDLRRPNVHRLIGEEMEPGVAEIFFNELEAEEAIKSTMAPGLDVLTAGKKVTNPAAILQSEKLAMIINGLKENYDYVLIDTPPFGVITDAAPLIQRCADGVVLVTKFGHTQANELNYTIENLEMVHANIIGTILTAYDHKESADYYYYNRSTYDSYSAYEEYEKKV